MRDAILNKAPIVDQTSVWSNVLPRHDPEERARPSHLADISGPISDIMMGLIPTNSAQ